MSNYPSSFTATHATRSDSMKHNEHWTTPLVLALEEVEKLHFLSLSTVAQYVGAACAMVRSSLRGVMHAADCVSTQGKESGISDTLDADLAALRDELVGSMTSVKRLLARTKGASLLPVSSCFFA